MKMYFERQRRRPPKLLDMLAILLAAANLCRHSQALVGYLHQTPSSSGNSSGYPIASSSSDYDLPNENDYLDVSASPSSTTRTNLVQEDLELAQQNNNYIFNSSLTTPTTTTTTEINTYNLPPEAPTTSLANLFDYNTLSLYSMSEIILIIVISVTLNLVTIVGNIMVLISFKMDRS